MKTDRRHFSGVVCSAFICGIIVSAGDAPAQSPRLADALRQLRESRSATPAVVEASVQTVVDEMAAGDQKGWEQVLDFADSGAARIEVRCAVVRGSSAMLNADMASRLVQRAREWARAPQSGVGPERVRLAMAVIDAAEQAHWRNALVGTEEYLALMEAVLVGPPYPQSSYQETALRLWDASTASGEARSRSAERIVMAMPQSAWMMDGVVDQLDRAAIDRLREAVRGAKTIDEFHWGAAAAIAQAGDQAAAPLLQDRAWLFASQGSRLADEVAAMAKRIQVQASPESVLAAIDEGPTNGAAFSAWLVRRAPQMGVTTQAMRAHVAQRLDQCRGEVARGDTRSRSTARAIRAAAQHVGVIGPNEFPEFKPQRKGVP